MAIPIKLNTWTRTSYSPAVKEWDFFSPKSKANLILIDHNRQPKLLKSIKGKRYVARLKAQSRTNKATINFGFRSQRSAEIGVKLIKSKFAPNLMRKLR